MGSVQIGSHRKALIADISDIGVTPWFLWRSLGGFSDLASKSFRRPFRMNTASSVLTHLGFDHLPARFRVYAPQRPAGSHARAEVAALRESEVLEPLPRQHGPPDFRDALSRCRGSLGFWIE